LAAKLAAEKPVFFNWMKSSQFHLESEGRIIVQVPKERRQWLEEDILPEHLKTIDRELSDAAGRSLKFHAEFVDFVPGAEESEPEEVFDSPHPPEEDSAPSEPSKATHETAAKVSADSSEKAGSAEDEAERKLMEFKNDPLIQEALTIFETEIAEVRPTSAS
jgi:hypothetical protein